MSDTRDDADQELIVAGLASGMEDSLASSLSSSFSMPPPPPRPTRTAADVNASAPADEDEDPPVEPIEGMDDWKSTYEGYVSEWQAESKVAREKALATRKRIEEERAEERIAETDKSISERRVRESSEKKREREERLLRELGDRAESSKGGRQVNEQRDQRVKEAWEMVKGDGGSEGKETSVDGRGVTEQDIRAGQVSNPNEKRPPVKQTAYDPTTSTEPMPPSMRDPTPAKPHAMPSEAETIARQSAASQSWVEVSPTSSSAEDLSPPGSRSISSEEDIPTLPRNTSRDDTTATDATPRPTKSRLTEDNFRPKIFRQKPERGEDRSHQTPPSQPPSLTLSLFSTPSHLSFARVVAVLGINMLLPFVNGVMLGFGEIFAREVIKVGKIWWREGGSLFRSTQRRETGYWDRDNDRDRDSMYAAGRGIAGLGLSGSGGFP